MYRYRFESTKNYDNCDVRKLGKVKGILFTHPRATKYGQEVVLKGCKLSIITDQKLYIGQFLTVESAPGRGLDGKSTTNLVHIEETKSIPLLVKISILRERYLKGIYRSLRGDRALIFLGIFLGSRDITRNTELYGQITRLGLSHLFVASGFNVSYIVSILKFLKKLFPRWLYISILSGVLMIYNIIVGFEIPILRATLLSLTTFIFKNSADSIHWLIIVGFSLCIINPLIITNLSFQLSFIATYAVLISNWMDNRNESAEKNKPILFIKELKISALVMVFIFPVLSTNFGVLNPATIFINPIISPFISVIMPLGIFTIVGHSRILDSVLFFVSDFLNVIIKALYELLGGYTIHVQMSPLGVIGYYFLLMVIAIIYVKRANASN